jgi:hypothetical protein
MNVTKLPSNIPFLQASNGEVLPSQPLSRLDVNDWCAIDGFHWTDSQTLLAYFAHGDLMKADRIGPIRGSGRKYTRKSPAWIRTRMDFQNVAMGAVQPSQDDDLVTDCQSIYCCRGADGSTSSQASGAPSEPCLGALLRSSSFERITPIGRSSSRSPFCVFLPRFSVMPRV